MTLWPYVSSHTFAFQILELVTYLARSLPEDQRQAFVQPFRDALATAEGQTPLEQDEERRRGAVRRVLEAVKDLGDGSDRGAHAILWWYIGCKAHCFGRDRGIL